MRKIFLSFIYMVLLLISFYLLIFPQQVSAANECTKTYTNPATIYQNSNSFTYYFFLSDTSDPNALYVVKADTGSWGIFGSDYISTPFNPDKPPTPIPPGAPSGAKAWIEGKIENQYNANQFSTDKKQHTLTLYKLLEQEPGLDPNKAPSADKLKTPFCDTLIYSTLENPGPTIQPVNCSLTNIAPSNINKNTPITVQGIIPSGIPNSETVYMGGSTTYNGYFSARDTATNTELKRVDYIPSDRKTINLDIGTLPKGRVNLTYVITRTKMPNDASTCIVSPEQCSTINVGSCQIQLEIGDTTGGVTIIPPTSIPSVAPTVAPGEPTYTPIPPLPSLAPICDQIDTQYTSQCKYCVEDRKGIWTAIGCLPTNLEVILKDYVFVYGTGITGGIAFLYFIYGAFLILTSGGNPEKIAEGKEIIISALSGLFLIIFSVFLLRVIGYDILKLPGFS